MLIGAMNNPRKELFSEIRWIGEMGLDFLDLTLEPPGAPSWRVDTKTVRQMLADYGLSVIGHTAYYLPIASPIEEVRRGAVAELKRCLEVFAEIGAPWMNIHPDRYAPMHDRAYFIRRDLQSIHELLEVARQVGVGLMIENLPGEFNTVQQLADLLEPLPELGLHLDIGHCNLLVPRNTADEIIRVYPPRLRHVHLHDNNGGSADQHLPLGAGTLEVGRHVRTLKAAGYNGTITLEVFTPDRQYLAYSRDILRRIWDTAG